MPTKDASKTKDSKPPSGPESPPSDGRKSFEIAIAIQKGEAVGPDEVFEVAKAYLQLLGRVFGHGEEKLLWSPAMSPRGQIYGLENDVKGIQSGRTVLYRNKSRWVIGGDRNSTRQVYGGPLIYFGESISEVEDKLLAEFGETADGRKLRPSGAEFEPIPVAETEVSTENASAPKKKKKKKKEKVEDDRW